MFFVETFQDWLVGEMRARDLSQAELARRAGVSRVTITNIVGGARQPGLDAISGIAKALDYSVDFVLKKVNQTPLHEGDDPQLEEANYLLSEMSPEARSLALALLRTVYQQHAPKPPNRSNRPRVAGSDGG